MRLSFFLALSLIACRGETGNVVTPPLASSPPLAASTSPRDAASGRMVIVTKEEARASGRVPMSVSVDLEGTAFIATKFPTPHGLLTLSGPPGGPLMVEMFVSGKLENEPAAERHERLVREHYGAMPAFHIGAAATVMLARAPQKALTFTTGESMTKTVWCAVMIPFVRNPTGGNEAIHELVVAFGVGGPRADCEEILSQPDLARIAKTFDMGF